MIYLSDYPVLIWLPLLTFTYHEILLIKLLYIIADSEGGFNVFFLFFLKTFFIMATRLQLSISNVGCRVLLIKEPNGYSFASYC